MADVLTSIRAEIDARLRELAPAIAEYERLSSAAAALTAESRAVSRRAAPGAPAGAPPSSRSSPPRRRGKARVKAARGSGRRERPAESPTAQAILAALEHGSHTVAELVLVTALPAADIRDSLRHLRKHKAIVKTDRLDGKSAYALAVTEAK
jgi:hypothetical protein